MSNPTLSRTWMAESISGALPPNPRDLPLWANSMTESGHATQTAAHKKFAGLAGPSRNVVEEREVRACTPYHAAGLKRKMPGDWGQSPQVRPSLLTTLFGSQTEE